MGRIASSVLVLPAGELLGMLPGLALGCPYWPESADLVAEVHARFQARIVVLRLLETEPGLTSGGRVSYLAELGSSELNAELLPVPESLRDRVHQRDSKRMPWAELGGPARSLAWARSALEPTGQTSFKAVQQRTWNLSTLWRLQPAPTNATLWLKQVPHFMSHESRVLRWLTRAAPGAAPTLVAADDSGRSLLAHVPGDDLYGAPVATRHRILDQLHAIQCVAAEATADLLALGVPDRRGAKFAADAAHKLLAWSADYPGLDEILKHLDEQVALLEEARLPATLVHSDNHPGNARESANGVTLLDWGEAFVGSPVTDLLGLIGGLSSVEAAPLVEHWCSVWKTVAPRSKPELALEVAPFLAALHGAATYAHFLQQIEESEWPYHRNDVPRCLGDARELLRRRLLPFDRRVRG